MKKIITSQEAAAFIKSGSSLMLGGFLGVGSPEKTINKIIEKGVDKLTLIINDSCMPDKPAGKLASSKQVNKIITSHVGTNPEVGSKITKGELIVEFFPLGTLTEKIRAGGFGLGGILTPTGIGTIVSEGKQILKANGKDYILELPLRADVAVIKAWKADKAGNLIYRKAGRNCNPVMATAADIVIAEVESVLEIGELDPEHIITPGIFVDYLVQA